MNRARKLVLMMGILVTGYLLVQFYFFKSCQIGMMCSANNTEVATKILMVVAATGISYWLLKPDSSQSPEPPPSSPAEPADTTTVSDSPPSA